MPNQAATAAATTGLAYSTLRHIEKLHDGTYLALVQTAVDTLKLVQISNPGGTPSFTTLAQTFPFSGGSNTVGDLHVAISGTTTDIWIAWTDNSSNTGLFVAHGTYSGGTFTWDNTSTSIAIGSFNSGFMVPTIVWTGTYLIIGMRANVSNYGITLTYTTTKNGSTGWVALFTLDGGNLSSHCYPVLRHDDTLGCTIIVYTLAGDTVLARVLDDANSPALANWSASVSLSGTVNVGAANLSAVLDTANQRLHVIYGNSGVGTNPQYNKATYTKTAITPSTSFSAGAAAGTFTGPTIGLDGASPPNVWIAWATGAVGSASDIDYVELQSPYGSGNLGGVVNLTSNTSTDNAYPHIPARAPFTGGYVPLLYAHAVSPWAVEYDNSITASGSGVSLGGASAGSSAASASISTTSSFSGTSHGAATASATLLVHHPLAGSSVGQSVASAVLAAGTPGMGISKISRVTGTQFANKSGAGYGVGDISGTAFDYISTDITGSGWAIEVNPWYGGMPSSGWYQIINPGLNTTLPQRTSKTGNQMTLLTTQSGGIVHWEADGPGGFQSSELLTFQAAGNFLELAPTSTDFRAYVKAIADGLDGNGIAWTAWMCVYPGDPGLVVFRLDQHNPSGSAITIDESDLQVIASLLGDNGVNPTGAWNPANGFTGKIGGAVINGWPAAGSHQAGTFDYAGITPDVGSGLDLGTGAAVLQDPSVQFGWNSSGYEMNESTSAVDPTRIKLGFGNNTGANWTIPAGQTNTVYVLRAFKRNLTSAVMAAIACDWKFPGTPTVTVGSYTTFSVDERAFVFAAAGNHLSAHLDMTPTFLTARFKPVLKITNWTGGDPQLRWGSSTLVNGTDYRHYLDTSTNTLYLQLYFDVVASGATTGQRNSDIIDVTPNWLLTSAGRGTASAAMPISHHLVGTSAATATASAALTVRHGLSGSSTGSSTATAAMPIAHHLAGASHGGSTATTTLATHSAMSGASVGRGTATANMPIAHRLVGTSHGGSVASAALGTHTTLTGSSAGTSTGRAGITSAHSLAGVAHGSATGIAILRIGHPLAGSASGTSAAKADMVVGRFSGSSHSTSTATTTLVIRHLLVGSSAGRSAANATTSLHVSWLMQSAGVSAATAPLGTHATFAGSAAGRAVALATIVMAHAFGGTAVGYAVATAVLAARVVPGKVGLVDSLVSQLSVIDTLSSA